VLVVDVRGVQSHLSAELTEPTEQAAGAPLWGGRSCPQDPETGMVYSFSLSVSFSYYLIYNVGFYVAEKVLGSKPITWMFEFLRTTMMRPQ
jgi:hypothetical protein